jgi:predicted alpha/beta-hydrolase family hydrolase
MFLVDGPMDARLTILLAHGAGAPMDSPWMTSVSRAFATAGIRTARFEFAYMASRRTSEIKRPPPRAETLRSEYLTAVDVIGVSDSLVIGGKSMGGRVASLVADELYSSGRIAGLLCIGYPFHPIGKPDQLRTAHLRAMRAPTLIVQGTRDPFGTPEEVSEYELSHTIEFLWLKDGDHDLKPRKAVSGFSAADHQRAMTDRVLAWSETLRVT